jgi:parallel beta-helix repeat protein
MSLVPYNLTALAEDDLVGGGKNIIAGASVNILKVLGGTAQIYSDEAGTSLITLPTVTDENGELKFFIEAGSYIFVINGVSYRVDVVSKKNAITTVATFADLVTTPAEAGQIVETLGYTTAGVGNLKYRATSGTPSALRTESESATANVYWKAFDYEYLTPYHVGYDGSTTPHLFIQYALDTGADVHLPADEYLVLFGHIKLNFDNQVLWGDGDETLIKLYPQEITEAGGVVKINGSDGDLRYGCKVHSLKIDYDKDNMTHTLDPRDNECLSIRYGRGHHVYNVTAINGIHEGIDIDYSENCILEFNSCHYNNGHGIHVSSGSKYNFIRYNRCSNNGWVEFRAGMDCYEGFEPTLPASSDNWYIGNECWDNYINYRILGPGNTFLENRSYEVDLSPQPDDLRGVRGGVTSWMSADGDSAPLVFTADTTGTNFAPWAEFRNAGNNPRFLIGMINDSGSEKLVITNQSGTVLFEIGSGSGYQTFTAAFSPASGAFGSITYQNSTGYIAKSGKSVTFNLRLSLSQLTIGTASGKISITGLTSAPQVTAPCQVCAVSNWNFSSPPAALNARVLGSGAIELEIPAPNATSQAFVNAADMKTGSGSFYNQIYISGSFVTS